MGLIFMYSYIDFLKFALSFTCSAICTVCLLYLVKRIIFRFRYRVTKQEIRETEAMLKTLTDKENENGRN